VTVENVEFSARPRRKQTDTTSSHGHHLNL